MVRKIGEDYYRSSRFHFQASFSESARFGATDQYNFGFLPVYFVSNVEVDVKCDDYWFLPTSPVKNDAPIDGHQGWLLQEPNDRRWPAGKHQNDLLIELESLFGFKPGTAITIRLIWSYKSRATRLENLKRMYHRVVPVIFPVLQRLQDTNCRVRIFVSEEEKHGARHENKYTFCASKWNLTSLEAITAEFREVCIRSFLCIVVQQANPYSMSKPNTDVHFKLS